LPCPHYAINKAERYYSRLSILNEELGKRRAEYEREMKEKRAG